MDNLEEDMVYEVKMDNISVQIEELLLDAMLAVLKKIKERNISFMKSEDKYQDEPYPF